MCMMTFFRDSLSHDVHVNLSVQRVIFLSLKIEGLHPLDRNDVSMDRMQQRMGNELRAHEAIAQDCSILFATKSY